MYTYFRFNKTVNTHEIEELVCDNISITWFYCLFKKSKQGSQFHSHSCFFFCRWITTAKTAVENINIGNRHLMYLHILPYNYCARNTLGHHIFTDTENEAIVSREYCSDFLFNHRYHLLLRIRLKRK